MATFVERDICGDFLEPLAAELLDMSSRMAGPFDFAELGRYRAKARTIREDDQAARDELKREFGHVAIPPSAATFARICTHYDVESSADLIEEIYTSDRAKAFQGRFESLMAKWMALEDKALRLLGLPPGPQIAGYPAERLMLLNPGLAAQSGIVSDRSIIEGTLHDVARYLQRLSANIRRDFTKPAATPPSEETTPPPPAGMPRWNKEELKLHFDGKVVAEYVRWPTSVGPILDRFQEKAWPEEIDTPLEKEPSKNAVIQLNMRTSEFGLLFDNVASRSKISWRAIPPKP